MRLRVLRHASFSTLSLVTHQNSVLPFPCLLITVVPGRGGLGANSFPRTLVLTFVDRGEEDTLAQWAKNMKTVLGSTDDTLVVVSDSQILSACRGLVLPCFYWPESSALRDIPRIAGVVHTLLSTGVAVVWTDVDIHWYCDLRSELRWGPSSRETGVRCSGIPGVDHITPRSWNPHVCRWCASLGGKGRRPLPHHSQLYRLIPPLKILRHPLTGLPNSGFLYAEPDQNLLTLLGNYLSLVGSDDDCELFSSMLSKRKEIWQEIDINLFELPRALAEPHGNNNEFRLAKLSTNVFDLNRTSQKATNEEYVF